MAILITGAAGLLGGALTAELLAKGLSVVAIVHRNNMVCDNSGAQLAAICDALPVAPSGAMVLRGDVTQPGLGLDAATIQWLHRHISAVVHCAALVRFEAAQVDLEAVNIEGARNAALLCPAARHVHISTAYVCGLAGGPVLEEPCDPAGPFGNRYEQSKAIAECAVKELRPDAVIARPSIIIGESETGRIRSFDTIYRAFKFIAEGKVAAVPALPSATLNFVPIDHVVAAIAALLDQPRSDGRIVHLAAREAIPAVRFLDLIGTVPGLNTPRVVDPGFFSHTRSSIAEQLSRPYWGYFQRNPDFATTTLAELTGMEAPEVNDAALLRQITYCIDAGFIRPQRQGV